MRLVSNNSKLRGATTWKNELDIDAGLAKTVAWLEKNLERYRPERYTV